MVDPLKIAVKGSPLTCDEFDEALDILQNRANHVGTQSCNTINDLDVCLITSSTVIAINTSISQTTARVTNLENTLSASGSIANDLNTLEATLTADINQNRASITALETEVDLLQTNVQGVEFNLASLTTLVTSNKSDLEIQIDNVEAVNVTQNARLTTVENRATVLNSNILSEAAARQLKDNSLQAEVDAEEINRINDISTVNLSIVDEITARTAGDVSLNNSITATNLAIDTKILTEKNARIAADANLQVEINNLASSLTNAIPTGTILPYAGNFNTIPSGYLLCAGAAISRTTYSNLFNIINTRYGIGNGTTTFNIPDLRDKTLYGAFAGNLDSSPPIIGENVKAITVGNLPPHSHTVSAGNHSHEVDTDHFHGLYIHNHTHTSGNVGSHSHSLNPYRKVALGGGNNDEAGAELTTIPVNDGSSNVYPNTAAAVASGPVINASPVQIYPPPFTGINKTDNGGGVKVTNLNGGYTTSTSTIGSNVDFDVRQAGLRVNFMIKS